MYPHEQSHQKHPTKNAFKISSYDCLCIIRAIQRDICERRHKAITASLYAREGKHTTYIHNVSCNTVATTHKRYIKCSIHTFEHAPALFFIDSTLFGSPPRPWDRCMFAESLRQLANRFIPTPVG